MTTTPDATPTTSSTPYVDDRGHVIITDPRWGRWHINASCGFMIGLGSWPGPANTVTNGGPRAILDDILARADDPDSDIAGLVRLLRDTGAGTTSDPDAARNRIGAFVARRFVDHFNTITAQLLETR